MSQRLDLLAAVKACPPEPESWVAAVRALGAWRKLDTELTRPKQPGHYTGRSQGEQFWTLTKSHFFDAARQALRDAFQALAGVPGGGTQRGQMIAKAQAQLHIRKQAEKATQLAAVAA